MIQKYIRTFLPKNYSITNWTSIQGFYKNLLTRELDSLEDLKKFLTDWSELEGVLEEDAGWRYIRISCDTTDLESKKNYIFYITTIVPEITAVTDQLHKKVLSAKEVHRLRQEIQYDLFFRKIQNKIRCYREENITIQTKIDLSIREFSVISGTMVVNISKEELTLQQAAAHLESTDRDFRKEVYNKIQKRRLQDKDRLNNLYSNLIQQRNQLALNAGFKNFRDYSFVAMNRFDYTPEDCFTFHEAIKLEVVPLLNELAENRKRTLSIPVLQPFDYAVDIQSRPSLRPFNNAQELIDKTIKVFSHIDPFLGNCLRIMERMGRFDLSSRKGKAPGGYNYPLNESGIPFIFMNATSTLGDMLTMFHEGGHAVHAFLTHNLTLNSFKHCPSEIAELASMSMELLTMPYWHVFFYNQEELNRAKKEHLMHVVSCLPWIAAIDAFQHWVYEHPNHSLSERAVNWSRIFTSFSDSITDWTGYENVKNFLWQKQLHLFEVPFYYIEYAIAQLGAISIWKNSQINPKQALGNYLSALKLGHTVPIRKVYQTAGVDFNFNRKYIRSLVQFVRKTWIEL